MASIIHNISLSKTGTDGTDFSTNYKSKCNLISRVNTLDANFQKTETYADFKTLIDGNNYRWSDVHYLCEDDYYNLYLVTGYKQVMASSRPSGTTVAFVTAGDKITTPKEIHGGVSMGWDFSNTDDDITAPTNFKRKQFDLQFIDKVWLKEGSVYYHNTPKGAYISFEVVCPDGEYYYKNDGTLTLATADTVVHKYVAKHFIQGDVPMGDELNTEAATLDPLPTNYYMRITVTTPDTDSTSNGFAEIELYRTRTVILN